MNLKVLLQVAPGGELLFTVVALEGLLPCVDSLMPDQIGDLTKGLFTARVVTLVRLLLVVDPRMLLQRGVLSEGLVTLLAAEIEIGV